MNQARPISSREYCHPPGQFVDKTGAGQPGDLRALAVQDEPSRIPLAGRGNADLQGEFAGGLAEESQLIEGLVDRQWGAWRPSFFN